MWPFNKKEEQAPQVGRTEICIPGNWESYQQFRDAVITSTGGKYMMVGGILMDVERKMHCTLGFYDHDGDMRRAFSMAGLVNQLTEEFLDEVKQHKNVVFFSADTGSLEAAENMARTAAMILGTGGIGVKVESTGLAFDKQTWLEIMDNFEIQDLHRLFVLDCIVDSENDTVYTCGMHNLGLKDTIVQGEDPNEAINLLRVFGYYQVLENPVLRDQQTFQQEADAPVYRLLEEEEQPYDMEDRFYNPYGRWRLVRVED